MVKKFTGKSDVSQGTHTFFGYSHRIQERFLFVFPGILMALVDMFWDDKT